MEQQANTVHHVYQSHCWHCGMFWIVIKPEVVEGGLKCPGCCKVNGYSIAENGDLLRHTPDSADEVHNVEK